MSLRSRPVQALALIGLALALAACKDSVDFDGEVANPAFAREAGPTILFDSGHHNRHEIDGSYAPFAELLSNDGFRLKETAGPATSLVPGKGTILAIVSAQSQTDTNAEPAFAPDEIAAIVRFVEQGGSLLVVIDHYPYPNAVESLLEPFGVKVGKGMTFDDGQYRQDLNDNSRLVFTAGKGLDPSHPITRGRNSGERVRTVETFTGDAVSAPPNGTSLLTLSPSAVNRLATPHVRRSGGDTVVNVEFGEPRPFGGWSQGIAFERGKGRVVVLAEAAMITAQEDGGRKLGMNSPGNDNRQFLLNIMRWLAHVL